MIRCRKSIASTGIVFIHYTDFLSHDIPYPFTSDARSVHASIYGVSESNSRNSRKNKTQDNARVLEALQSDTWDNTRSPALAISNDQLRGGDWVYIDMRCVRNNEKQDWSKVLHDFFQSRWHEVFISLKVFRNQIHQEKYDNHLSIYFW